MQVLYTVHARFISFTAYNGFQFLFSYGFDFNLVFASAVFQFQWAASYGTGCLGWNFEPVCSSGKLWHDPWKWPTWLWSIICTRVTICGTVLSTASQRAGPCGEVVCCTHRERAAARATQRHFRLRHCRLPMPHCSATIRTFEPGRVPPRRLRNQRAGDTGITCTHWKPLHVGAFLLLSMISRKRKSSKVYPKSSIVKLPPLHHLRTIFARIS